MRLPPGLLPGLLAVSCIGVVVTASGLIIGYPVLTGQGLRYALAAAVLRLLLRRQPPVARPRPATLVRVAVVAATGMVGFNAAILVALRTSEPAVVSVTIGISPLVLAVLGAVQAGRRPAARTVLAAAGVVAGVAVVDGWGRTSAAGLAMAVLAMLGEASFSLLAVPLVGPMGALRLSYYECLAATAECLAGGLLLNPAGLLRPPGPVAGTVITFLGLVTALAFVCWYSALGRLGADRAGLLSGLIPVLTAVTAPLAGVGRLGAAQLTGSLLVGAAVAAGLSTRRRPAGASTPERQTSDPRQPAGS